MTKSKVPRRQPARSSLWYTNDPVVLLLAHTIRPQMNERIGSKLSVNPYNIMVDLIGITTLYHLDRRGKQLPLPVLVSRS